MDNNLRPGGFYGNEYSIRLRLFEFLPTGREGKVLRGVCHSVHKWPHRYSITDHPYYGAVGTHPAGMLSFYRPQRSCVKVMFLHLSVSHSIHRGWSPWADTPLGQTPPCTVHAGIRSTSGRYASHWNAYFIHSFTILAQIQDYLGLIPVPIK